MGVLHGESTHINLEPFFYNLFRLKERFEVLGMIIKDSKVYLPDLEKFHNWFGFHFWRGKYLIPGFGFLVDKKSLKDLKQQSWSILEATHPKAAALIISGSVHRG